MLKEFPAIFGILLAVCSLMPLECSLRAQSTAQQVGTRSRAGLPTGVWHSEHSTNHLDYRRPITGQQILSIGETRSLLELRTDSGHVLRAELKKMGQKRQQTIFKVKRVEGTRLGLGGVEIKEGARLRAVFGQEQARSRQAATESVTFRLILFPPTKGNKRNPQPVSIEMKQSNKLVNESGRWYGKTDLIAYLDWRSSAPDGQHAVLATASDKSESKARQRVAEDIKRLAAKGRWKGLSQSTFLLNPNQFYDYKTTSNYGGKRLLLIYSHVPHASIVYTGRKKPSGYISHLKYGTNYPLLLNEGGYNLTIRFTTSPEPGTLERYQGKIPITVIVFGNGFGDYGGGVNFEEFGLASPQQSDVTFRRVTKMAAAGYFETLRRGTIKNKNELGQAVATLIRNEALDSLLRDLAPDATDSEIGFLNRLSQAIISNDIHYLSLMRDVCREQLLQEIERLRPELSPTAGVIDFLLDLHLQRETYQENERR